MEPKNTSNILAKIQASVDLIPCYDGNPDQLHRFLSISETILIQFHDPAVPVSSKSQFILQSILKKLKGKAKEIISKHRNISWVVIKTVLLQNFGHVRDENSFYRDLVCLRQGNEPVQYFYNKCTQMLKTIISYVCLNETDQIVVQHKREQYTAQTLKSFIAGLKEPMGSTVRDMNPPDLPTALQYVKQEVNKENALVKSPEKPKPIRPSMSNYRPPQRCGYGRHYPPQNPVVTNYPKPILNLNRFNPTSSFRNSVISEMYNSIVSYGSYVSNFNDDVEEWKPDDNTYQYVDYNEPELSHQSDIEDEYDDEENSTEQLIPQMDHVFFEDSYNEEECDEQNPDRY